MLFNLVVLIVLFIAIVGLIQYKQPRLVRDHPVQRVTPEVQPPSQVGDLIFTPSQVIPVAIGSTLCPEHLAPTIYQSIVLQGQSGYLVLLNHEILRFTLPSDDPIDTIQVAPQHSSLDGVVFNISYCTSCHDASQVQLVWYDYQNCQYFVDKHTLRIVPN